MKTLAGAGACIVFVSPDKVFSLGKFALVVLVFQMTERDQREIEKNVQVKITKKRQPYCFQ